MLPQPDKLWDSTGDISPGQSSCSSDTGEVLIRSTRVLLSERGDKSGPGPGSVQITVRKLRDRPVQPPAAEPAQRSETEKQQRPNVPRKPDNAPPQRAAVQSLPDRPTLKKPEWTKENRVPTGKQPAATDRKLSAGTHSHRQPGHDLLTSRFAAGSRGVSLAALKQRSHSVPCRREVKVQLLDPGPLQSSSQDAVCVAGVQMEERLSSGCLGNNTNTTAAHQIKSDVEAQVSQLADGVQRLLQAHRDDSDRGWSLSQQTLHHLETLHSQQLQLQSQLMESALRIVLSHAPVPTTSDLTASSQPDHLRVTHPDPAANLSNQQQSSMATRASTAETGPVAMATPCSDRWLEQTSDDRCHQGDASVSKAAQPATGSHLQFSANHSQAAVRKANEMLKEMGRLKSEMKLLLTPEDSLKTTRPGPDHYQSPQRLLLSQQNLPQSNHFKSQSQQTEPQQSQLQQSKSHKKSQSQQIQSHQNPFQPNQLERSQTHQTQSQQSPSVLVKRRPLVPSTLEEAGRVLRQVQRQKKILEENVEALLRAKTGEVLHCQLEALAANRDTTEEARIKRTVDAWINTLTEDIQAEMDSEDAAHKYSASRDAPATSQQRAAESSAHAGRGRPVSMLRGNRNKTAAAKRSRGQTSGHRLGALPDGPAGGRTEGEQVEVDGESYLTRLYGRAPYEGLRRTLKKSPYLRFSSPGSPLSRKPRPRLVESVRGVKLKSCKTQTCLAPPLSWSAGRPQPHYIITSSPLTSGEPADRTVTSADKYSIPMAIPLGCPRVDLSSRCLMEQRQEVTSQPTAPPTSSVVDFDKEACELQPQLSVNLQAELPEADEAPPPPVDIMERKIEEEENEDVFPGTDFLCVADVIQEEVSVVGEEGVELDGGLSPPPVLFQGPVFPPKARSELPAQDQSSVLGFNLQRDALENRLVEWVEQQLMSRMISEMYRPPPSDPAQNDSTNQSEPEEQSITSDTVETAGSRGLQLFVDSNLPVKSALIRQLVDEVLTEHISRMLGQRDNQEMGPEPELEPPAPGPGAEWENKLVLLVPTPEPTPPPSLSLPSRETPPLITPAPSEPTSLLNEESPQSITAPEPVATPTPSPKSTHSARSPPAVHEAPPPLTWGDAELPSGKERLEEHLDTHTQPGLMSVAEDKPPLSFPLLLPPSILPAAPSLSPPPLAPEARPASPSSSSEDNSSSSSSEVTAGMDAALKNISEGEVLISVNQLAAMTEEEAVCSFSSSLQELQEMDFDPPSELQVRGNELLLTKMEQRATHTHRGERPQPEGSWGRNQEGEEVSVGEVKNDWTTKLHRTTNPRSDRKSTGARQGQTSSPGQISVCADVSEVSLEATSQGSLTTGDLLMNLNGALTSPFQTSLSPEDTHTAGQVAPSLVRQYDTQTAGRRRMDFHLPSIRPEEEEVMKSAAQTPPPAMFSKEK